MGPGGPATPSQNTATTSSLPAVGVTPPPPLGGPPLAHIPPGAGPPQFRALIPPFVSFMFPVTVKSRNSVCWFISELCEMSDSAVWHIGTCISKKPAFVFSFQILSTVVVSWGGSSDQVVWQLTVPYCVIKWQYILSAHSCI